MQQAITSEVLEWLAEPSGECDRGKLLTVLNKARQRMYQFYQEIPLFEITLSFEVQRFAEPAQHGFNGAGTSTYLGVTLPREYQNAEAVWLDDLPAALYTSWREWQRGHSCFCTCGITSTDINTPFSSERDLLPGQSDVLQVVATDHRDVGKNFSLRGVDGFGRHFFEQFKLSLEPQFTSSTVVSLESGAGVTKQRTEGVVILSEKSGRVLSVYRPDETMPAYRRLRLTGVDAGCRVLIRGGRRFAPVFFDTDVVETDNRIAFEEMARFIRLNEKANKDGGDLRSAAGHLEQCKQALKGDKARDLGRTKQMSVRSVVPSFNRRSLGRW